MGKTLEDILNDEFEMSEASGGNEKTASQESVDNDIEKLAAEIGLVPAAASKETKSPGGQVKEANVGLSSLYEEMFPEEAVGASGEVKVAAQDKVAEKEEAMGAVAFDSFAAHFDRHITKMATELSGSAELSPVSEGTDGKPVQTMKDNQPANSEKAIDTKPEVTNKVTAQKGPEVTGEEEQHAPAGNGEQIKAAALRKAMLAASLEE